MAGGDDQDGGGPQTPGQLLARPVFRPEVAPLENLAARVWFPDALLGTPAANQLSAWQ
jgi:hypothetical protein